MVFYPFALRLKAKFVSDSDRGNDALVVHRRFEIEREKMRRAETGMVTVVFVRFRRGKRSPRKEIER